MGVVVMLIGVLVIALPITVIGANFAAVYTEAQKAEGMTEIMVQLFLAHSEYEMFVEQMSEAAARMAGRLRRSYGVLFVFSLVPMAPPLLALAFLAAGAVCCGGGLAVSKLTAIFGNACLGFSVARTQEAEPITDESGRLLYTVVGYGLIGVFSAIASGLAGNGDAAEYGAYHNDDRVQNGDNPAHAAFAVLSAGAFLGILLTFAFDGSYTRSPFSMPGLPGKYHRFVFPCITLYAVIALNLYMTQDATVADTKTNQDDFWDDGHSFADDSYNPDEAALGMCWAAAMVAVLLSCCFCCFCFCVGFG